MELEETVRQMLSSESGFGVDMSAVKVQLVARPRRGSSACTSATILITVDKQWTKEDRTAWKHVVVKLRSWVGVFLLSQRGI